MVRDDSISIDQSKYAKEILVKFGYENAHAVGNQMETNVHLIPATDKDEVDIGFDYRGAVGMLMYLATCTRIDLAYVLGQLS